MKIRTFCETDTVEVVKLWESCGLTRAWNDPNKDIQRKLTTQAELFLVGELDNSVIATAMAGYDGHRGSVYYLAVAPEHRHSGYGRELMEKVESLLVERGCPKLNILLRSTNIDVLKFYENHDYGIDDVICLGKRLIPDV